MIVFIWQATENASGKALVFTSLLCAWEHFKHLSVKDFPNSVLIQNPELETQFTDFGWKTFMEKAMKEEAEQNNKD